jgi:hypothetical protein
VTLSAWAGRTGIARAIVAVLAFAMLASPVRAGDYSRWAAVVLAGDWRSHSGADTDSFDNARRDVAKALVKAGFEPSNIVQFSLRPPRPGDGPDVTVDARVPIRAFQAAAATAPEGCLFYLTSHGSPDGAVFGPSLMLTPPMLARVIDETCPARPSVVIVSACFSGVFVQPLAGPQHMVLTAARPDRSSFGCGDKDKYPYFDACVLQSLPHSNSFPKLAQLATACVARRETEEHLTPPSEPQTWIGVEARMILPLEILGKP